MTDSNGSDIPSFKVYRDKPPSLKEAQLFVGGYVEVVQLGRDIQVLCNEDGWLDALPLNVAISTLCGRVIVGNAIVLYGNALWT